MTARFGDLGIKKHQNRSFYHLGAWPQDAKTFEFESLRPQDFEFETFEILGQCSCMLKVSWEFKNVPIEAFSSQGHGPRMSKPSNVKFLDPKTSNSKLLTSWAMRLDAKSFDWFRSWNITGLDVWVSKNIQKPAASRYMAPRCQNIGIWSFLNSRTSNSKLLLSWGHAPGC